MEMAIGSVATPFSSVELSRLVCSPSPRSPLVFSKSKIVRFRALKKTLERLTVRGSSSIKGLLGPSRGGADLLERPTFDQSQFEPITQVEAGGDIGRVGDRRIVRSGDSYRVLLVDDKRHTQQLVEKVLPQAVPSVTPDDARRIFHESREQGVAVVVVALKEHAEFYAQMMVRGGLRSAIEPDSNTV